MLKTFSIDIIVGLVRRAKLFLVFQALSFICIISPKEGEEVIEDHNEGNKNRRLKDSLTRMFPRK